MAEPIEVWWQRRQRSKQCDVPYPIGSYRADWERYPVLIRQYHPEFNAGITLTQIPPAAEVFLSWQCEFGHIFVATPEEQRNRPGGKRRQSVWCPDCAYLANPPRIRTEPRNGWPAAAHNPGERRAHDRKEDAGQRRQPATGQNRFAPAVPGDSFFSPLAPAPASAAEGDLRHRLRACYEFDLGHNAVAVSRAFFGRLEVWPDIVIPELRIAIEYDTIGRHGLEHVGKRENTDRAKDRLLRSARWEVIRIRCGKLQPLGPYDLTASGVTGVLMSRLDDRLAEIRGDLIVRAYRS
jgi:hypothetical protein